jgi:hypothetical protein
LMVGGLGLQVLALTRAPLAVVQPILAGGLIGLAAAGPRLLGERLSSRHRLALVLIVAAVVAVAGSAHSRAPAVVHVPAGAFAVMGAVVAGCAGSAAWIAGRRRSARSVLGLSVAAGILYGYGAVAEKAVSTRLAAHGVWWGAVTSLRTPYPWVFAAATLAGMIVFQSGLQAHPASLMACLTNSASTLCALVGAAAVFGEAALPGGAWSILRLAGLALGAMAVAVLVGDPAERSADPEVARSRPDHAVAP